MITTKSNRCKDSVFQAFNWVRRHYNPGKHLKTGTSKIWWSTQTKSDRIVPLWSIQTLSLNQCNLKVRTQRATPNQNLRGNQNYHYILTSTTMQAPSPKTNLTLY